MKNMKFSYCFLVFLTSACFKFASKEHVMYCKFFSKPRWLWILPHKQICNLTRKFSIEVATCTKYQLKVPCGFDHCTTLYIEFFMGIQLSGALYFYSSIIQLAGDNTRIASEAWLQNRAYRFKAKLWCLDFWSAFGLAG